MTGASKPGWPLLKTLFSLSGWWEGKSIWRTF
jgi:hypothetical protein